VRVVDLSRQTNTNSIKYVITILMRMVLLYFKPASILGTLQYFLLGAYQGRIFLTLTN